MWRYKEEAELIGLEMAKTPLSNVIIYLNEADFDYSDMSDFEMYKNYLEITSKDDDFID